MVDWITKEDSKTRYRRFLKLLVWMFPEDIKRAIFRHRLRGSTYSAIGRMFDLSATRIKQISHPVILIRRFGKNKYWKEELKILLYGDW
jgi:hypothetical protein